MTDIVCYSPVMNILIVHAHPEPKSFTSALKNKAVQVLEALGHTVAVSDLHAMNFDPVARKTDFIEVADPAHFRYNREGGAALAKGTPADRFAGFHPTLAAEMAKLDRAELVIFTAPVWWFSLPAILKGWVDKVFALNFAYGHSATYETGLLKGKKALLALTSGGPSPWYTAEGVNGTIETNFYHLNHGVFWYCGMTVLEPFVAYGVGRASDVERELFLEAWRQRLETLDSAVVLYPS